MTSRIVRGVDALSESERSDFFWKCMVRAVYLQLVLFAATFATGIAIQFVVTFVGLFFVEEAAQLDGLIRVLQLLALAPWTLAMMWWYTRWVFRTRFGQLTAVFWDPIDAPEPNSALQATREDARA